MHKLPCKQACALVTLWAFQGVVPLAPSFSPPVVAAITVLLSS